MVPGSVLVIPLDSWLVWAEGYGAIALIVWLGFVVWQAGWGERDANVRPAAQIVRVVAGGLLVGALWPIWAALAGLALTVAVFAA